MEKTEIRIVSGAQTGVDQGALHAAIDLGLAWGGWVPKGWRTENGTVASMFRPGMREHASSNYLGRTRQNVVDSHATLIVTNSYPISGGTLKTCIFCQEMQRSHFVVSLGDAEAERRVLAWLSDILAQDQRRPFVLNVAGPRESKSRGIQKKTRRFLGKIANMLLSK